MKVFEYKNINVSYSEAGKGSALVFLHGFLENKELWHPIATHFSTKHRVIAIDLLGHGNTGCTGYIHSMEDQADMVFALITHLRLRKINLIGHSMGGYIALAFADLYPDYVKSISLINSTSRADSQERKANRERAIDAVKKNAGMFVRMATQNLFDPKTHKEIKDKINIFTKNALQTSTQGIIASLEGMKSRVDREVLLHFGPYPKLIIAGEKDNIMPIEDIKDEVTNTEVELHILDCGHIAPLENPSLVIDCLKNFIKSL